MNAIPRNRQRKIKRLGLQWFEATVAGFMVSMVLFVAHSIAPDYIDATTSIQARLGDLLANASPTREPDATPSIPPIVFLDFWAIGKDVEQKGPEVSRAEVADLIQLVDNAGARAALIDFSVAGPSDDNTTLNRALRDLRQTQVVFPAWLAVRATDACGGNTAEKEGPQAGRRERFLYKQSVLEDVGPRVWQGHDDIESDFDGRVRRNCPVVRATWKDAEVVVDLPSTALLAAALAMKDIAPRGASEEGATAVFECKPSRATVLFLARRARDSANGKIDDTSECPINAPVFAPQRLRFVQDADRNEAADPRGVGRHSLPSSAFVHVKLTPHQPVSIDPSALRGAVVVIGASHEMSGDRAVTPIGVLPGAMLLVNVIHDAMSHGFDQEPQAGKWGRGIEALVECFLVAVGAFLFLVLREVGFAAGRRIEKWPFRRTSERNGARTRDDAGSSRYAHMAREFVSMLWTLFAIFAVFVSLILLLILFSHWSSLPLLTSVDLSGGALGLLLDVGSRLDEAVRKWGESRHKLESHGH